MGKVGSSDVTFLGTFVSKPADILSLLTAFKQFLPVSISSLAIAPGEEEKFTSECIKEAGGRKTIKPTG